MQEIILSIGVAALVSVAVSAWMIKKATIRYFEIVDGYVKDVCDATIKSNQETLATVRKLTQSFHREQ